MTEGKMGTIDHMPLPNGCTLYWKPNEAGGTTYYTDENGVITVVWDTAITDLDSLLYAIALEAENRGVLDFGLKTLITYLGKVK